MRLKITCMKRYSLRLTVALLAFLISLGVFYFWTYHHNPVVLEISTDCRGMTNPRGEVLDFRLYESGRVESGNYPPQDSYGFNLRYWFSRAHSQLSPAEVEELINLAEQPDFLAAQDEYPPLLHGTDSEFRTTIVFNHAGRQKRIVVIDYLGDDGVSGAEARYPQSLLKLLQKVYATKHKL